MKFWVKILLFLSSYIPLFLIFAIRNYSNIWVASIFIGVILLCIFIWILIFIISRKQTYRSGQRVIKIENKMSESLTYLTPYLIAFLSLDMTKWQDSLSILILLAVLFIICLNTDLLYINPMLLFVKYKFYKVTLRDPSAGPQMSGYEVILITKRDNIKIDDKISIQEVDDDTFLEVIK
jgi:hypothetical protein